jgi:uncharacterized delta-60 repeat protein
LAVALGVLGSLCVVGGLPGVARADPGELDPSFDTDGKVLTDLGGTDWAQAVALQPDGKIVVAGHSDTGDGLDFALARYHRDGSLDHSFDGDGMLTTDFGGEEIANAVALQRNGKIVVAGPASVGTDDIGLARYLGRQEPPSRLIWGLAGGGVQEEPPTLPSPGTPPSRPPRPFSGPLRQVACVRPRLSASGGTLRAVRAWARHLPAGPLLLQYLRRVGWRRDTAQRPLFGVTAKPLAG